MVSRKQLAKKIIQSEKIIAQKIKEKIKLKFVVFLAIVVLIFFLVAGFATELKASLDAFIMVYGLLAVFAISFLSDAIMQPIGPDLPIFTGILLGMQPVQVTLVALGASALATVVGYYLGLKWGKKGFTKFYGKERYRKLTEKYEKHSYIIPIAALTPVPYVPVCWISGIFHMNILKFFLYAMVPRTVRLVAVALFAYSFVA